jgi:hypothetical protein
MFPLTDKESDAAGEKADPVLLGELECEEGVGRFFGDEAEWLVCKGGGSTAPGSLFGAMLDAERRDWW